MSNILINRGLPTVKQLQCFLVVANELSFKNAAKRLHMTPPPLTRQIQCLESNLGCQLFFRNTHSVHLTDAGVELVDRAREILLSLEELTYLKFKHVQC